MRGKGRGKLVGEERKSATRKRKHTSEIENRGTRGLKKRG